MFEKHARRRERQSFAGDSLVVTLARTAPGWQTSITPAGADRMAGVSTYTYETLGVSAARNRFTPFVREGSRRARGMAVF